MSDILSRIIQDKRQEVAAAKERISLDQVKQQAADTDLPRNFFKALTRPKDELRVIAEVKRASPSAGLIREHFDPATIATNYFQNGAAAISCLTDQKYFQGSPDYIERPFRA